MITLEISHPISVGDLESYPDELRDASYTRVSCT